MVDMKEKIVKEVMIPLSDYATISEDATLKDAIKELRAAREDTKYTRKHRALLVYNSNNDITGKISFRCIFKALEPKYSQFEHPENLSSLGLTRFGFNEDFLTSLLDNYNLWDERLEELVQKAAELKVKSIMYKPTSKGEYVNEESSVAEAIHQFILGCHQSLLVLDGKQVTGVVRLVDLFDLVSDIVDETL